MMSNGFYGKSLTMLTFIFLTMVIESRCQKKWRLLQKNNQNPTLDDGTQSQNSTVQQQNVLVQNVVPTHIGSLVFGKYIVTEVNNIVPNIQIKVDLNQTKIIVEACNWHTSTFQFVQANQGFQIKQPFFSTQLYRLDNKIDKVIIDAFKVVNKAHTQANILVIFDQNKTNQIKMTYLNTIPQTTPQMKKQAKSQCEQDQQKIKAVQNNFEKSSTNKNYKSSTTGSWDQNTKNSSKKSGAKKSKNKKANFINKNRRELGRNERIIEKKSQYQGKKLEQNNLQQTNKQHRVKSNF